MDSDFPKDSMAYAAYPTAFVYNFEREKDNTLKFKKIKHLLWGDWIKLIDYDYKKDKKSGVLSTQENKYVCEKSKGMIPVYVRGTRGYMYKKHLQKNRLLEVVFVDVGQGDGALLMTPDGKKFIIDAGVGDNMYRYLSWRFAEFKEVVDDFDGFIVTHPDKDHYYGFRQLIKDENVKAKNLWHNGIVERPLKPKKKDVKDTCLGSKQDDDGQVFLTDLGVCRTLGHRFV